MKRLTTLPALAALVIFILIIAISGPVLAYEPGDGSAPSPIEWETYLPPRAAVEHPVNAGLKGALSYSHPIWLPPLLARLHLSLDYGSSSGESREMALGWSIGGILEIHRPLARAFSRGELTLTGPVNATLLPDGASIYRGANTSTLEVTATYDSSADSFEVRTSEGDTWELEAADDGSASPDGTASWRAVSYTDMSGNTVEFSYDSDHRLEAVEAGGNSSTGESHFIRISFSYRTRTNGITSFAAGFGEPHQSYLSRIRVSADPSGAGWKRLRSYTLTNEEVAGKVRLVRIAETGYDYAAGTSLTLPATDFSYSEYDDSMDAVDEDYDAPPDLGRTVYEVDSGSGSFVDSYQEAIMADLNGDGLADYVESDGSSWSVRIREMDHTSGDVSWAAAVTISAPALYLNQWDRDPATSNQIVKLADLDGDGRLDLISAWEWSLADTGSRSYISIPWGVFYGTSGGGFESTSVWENGPTVYMERKSAASTDTSQLRQTLMDLNDDGWLDIVIAWFGDTKVTVYYHNGYRGGGWSSTARTLAAPWLEDLDDTGSSLSAGLSQQDFDSFSAYPEYYVTDTYTWGRLADINADGFADYLVSEQGISRVGGSSGNWAVYYGNGSGWEEKEEWPCSVSYLSRTYQGTGSSDQITNSGLMDVDGDGLPDIVDSENGYWLRNLGDGFDAAGSLPSWWPSRTSRVEIDETTSGSVRRVTHTTTRAVRDMNGDGVQDAAECGALGDDIDGDGVLDEMLETEFGVYPVPHLMIKVDREGGRESEIVYGPSTAESPSGIPSASQELRALIHLVKKITTRDRISRETALSEYCYYDGYHADGYFYGFGEIEVRNRTGSPARWSRTVTTYDLGTSTPRYPPLVSYRATYTDPDLVFAPGLSAGGSGSAALLRSEETISRKTYQGTHKLPYLIEVTRAGENPSAAAKTTSTQLYYNDRGALEHILFDGGDGFSRDQTDLEIFYEYAYDTSSFLRRLAYVDTRGWDHLNNTWRQMGLRLYFYDGHTAYNDYLTDGMLTKEQIFSGWVDGGETLTGSCLEWKYTRGRRGELSLITDTNRGRNTNFTWQYGAAVKETVTNDLGHTTTYGIDAAGRITSVTGPNGVVSDRLRDPAGRVMEETVTDAAGRNFNLVSNEFHESAEPFYSVTRRYDETGAPEAAKYLVYDGGGNPVQQWTTGTDGSFFVTGLKYDLTGNLLYSTHPHARTAFTSTISGSYRDRMAVNYYDAYGTLRESWADYDAGLGHSLLYMKGPWIKETIDAEGYATILTYDAYGRIVMTQQGQTSGGQAGYFRSVTGCYEYDAMNNLVGFRDARSNEYEYSFDAAARLRMIQGPGIGYRTYTYDGTLVTGLADSAGRSVQTIYDTLDRPSERRISDPLDPAHPLISTWSYDTRWIGAAGEIIDPAGSISYRYDDRGRVMETTRTFSDFTDPVVLARTLDRYGRPTELGLPSGEVMTYTRSNGFLTRARFNTLDTTAIDFNYDTYGRKTGWETSLGHRAEARYNPLWVETMTMEHPGSGYSRQRNYTYLDNGLLASRSEGTVGMFLPASTENYTYDELMRLTEVSEQTVAVPSAAAVETYQFADTAGNMRERLDPVSGKTWHYYYPASGGRPTGCYDTASGDTRTFSYDAAGFLKTLSDSAAGTVTTYYYQGNGLLRAAKIDGDTRLILDYSPDGSISRRSFTDQTTAPREYAFGPWCLDDESGKVTETFDSGAAPIGALFTTSTATERRWFVREADGHTAALLDDGGYNVGSRQLGAYGRKRSETGEQWRRGSFHGSEQERDDELGLQAMGARHMLTGEGIFLQPEPMLLLPISQAVLNDPLKLHPYRYARNNPVAFADRDGLLPILCGWAGFVDQPAPPPPVNVNPGLYDTLAGIRARDTAERMGGRFGAAQKGGITSITREQATIFMARVLDAISATEKGDEEIIPEPEVQEGFDPLKEKHMRMEKILRLELDNYFQDPKLTEDEIRNSIIEYVNDASPYIRDNITRLTDGYIQPEDLDAYEQAYGDPEQVVQPLDIYDLDTGYDIDTGETDDTGI